MEDAGEVLLDRCWADHEGFGDATVGLAFGHRGEHVAFTSAEPVERPVVLAAAEHPRDDLRIQRGPACGDAGDRVDEALDGTHTLLEEIADSLGVVPDQLERVALIVELGEYEHAGLGPPTADLDRRPQTIVSVAGRSGPEPDADLVHGDSRANGAGS